MRYLSPRQAAQQWGMSPRYAYYLLKSDAVPHVIAAERFYLVPDGLEKPSIKDRGKYPPRQDVYEPISKTASRWGVSPRWVLQKIDRGDLPDAIRVDHNYFLPVGVRSTENAEKYAAV